MKKIMNEDDEDKDDKLEKEKLFQRNHFSSSIVKLTTSESISGQSVNYIDKLWIIIPILKLENNKWTEFYYSKTKIILEKFVIEFS